MSAFVVDTNVPVAASGRAEQAPPGCVLACIDALEQIVLNGSILLDDAMLILSEYMHNLSMSGQPGPGDAFMKWVWLNQADPQGCSKIPITPRTEDPEDFDEFPRDPELAGFDRRDRKFVAVALASKSSPSVLNATDTGWWLYRIRLQRHGLRLCFLCPTIMA